MVERWKELAGQYNVQLSERLGRMAMPAFDPSSPKRRLTMRTSDAGHAVGMLRYLQRKTGGMTSPLETTALIGAIDRVGLLVVERHSDLAYPPNGARLRTCAQNCTVVTVDYGGIRQTGPDGVRTMPLVQPPDETETNALVRSFLERDLEMLASGAGAPASDLLSESLESLQARSGFRTEILESPAGHQLHPAFNLAFRAVMGQ